MELDPISQLNFTCDFETDGRAIVRVDPSSLLNSNCLSEFKHNNLMGMYLPKEDYITAYGSAVHETGASLLCGASSKEALAKGLEYYTSRNIDSKGDYRNEAHLVMTLDKYTRKYTNDLFVPLKRGSEFAVEQPFAIKLFETEYAVYLLVGKIDALGAYNGVKCIKDIKTTGYNLPDKYFEKYKCSVQMMLYAFAAKQLGWVDYLPPIIIDGVFLSNDTTCCSLKRSNFISFTDEMVHDALNWVRSKCLEIDDAIARKTWTKNPTVCYRYGKDCIFNRLCWGKEIERKMAITFFKQRRYDPNTFGEQE
jgi:hypothetical protein